MGVTGTWAEKTRFWIPRKGCLQVDDKTCGMAGVKHRWAPRYLGAFELQVRFQRDPCFSLPAIVRAALAIRISENDLDRRDHHGADGVGAKLELKYY